MLKRFLPPTLVLASATLVDAHYRTIPQRDSRGLAKFSANAPLAMLDQYVGNLRELEGIGLDAGNEDRGIAATVVEVHEALDQYGIPHLFEIYRGDHLSGVGERIRTQMLPFFSRVLAFE